MLLSIHYYSTKLLLSAPVLVGFLKEHDSEHKSSREMTALLESAVPVIEDDCDGAQELQTIVSVVNKSAPDFLNCNAAWWSCNFICESVKVSGVQ